MDSPNHREGVDCVVRPSSISAILESNLKRIHRPESNYPRVPRRVKSKAYVDEEFSVVFTLHVFPIQRGVLCKEGSPWVCRRVLVAGGRGLDTSNVDNEEERLVTVEVTVLLAT